MIVFQRYIGFTYVLSAIIFCLSCSPIFKVANSKAELQYFGDKSNLSAAIFEKLGYQVKSFTEGNPSEWHKENFQTLWSRTYQVKNQTSLKEQANTFTRYMVVEEVYANTELADERLKRIQEKPPDLTLETQYYWMVTGFQYQKNVYFIQTDAVVFNYYMGDFADKLAKEIRK